MMPSTRMPRPAGVHTQGKTTHHSVRPEHAAHPAFPSRGLGPEPTQPQEKTHRDGRVLGFQPRPSAKPPFFCVDIVTSGGSHPTSPSPSWYHLVMFTHSEDVHCQVARKSHLAYVPFFCPQSWSVGLQTPPAKSSCKRFHTWCSPSANGFGFTFVRRARRRVRRRGRNGKSECTHRCCLTGRCRHHPDDSPAPVHSDLAILCQGLHPHFTALPSTPFTISSMSLDQPCSLAKVKKLSQTCSKFFPLASLLSDNL